LWLDADLNYSCALFESQTDSLERAQLNKLAWFHDRLRLTPESRILDIGCGWGGNLKYLTRDRGLRAVTGITLCEQQYVYLQREALVGADVDCVSYAEYEPSEPYDALISIGMFEHVCTPEQIRSGACKAIYQDYFRRAWRWTKPGSYFGLQTVIGGRMPRDAALLRELSWVTRGIFPGAISPRLEFVTAAAAPYWELVELHTRREHYARTAELWLGRLREHGAEIRGRWSADLFLDYQRYLQACVVMFTRGHQSLAQLVLRRNERSHDGLRADPCSM
jgi:cyclopropane-fatty-acyl-phospholipid synthase